MDETGQRCGKQKEAIPNPLLSDVCIPFNSLIQPAEDDDVG
ncbi:hypothetical protein [Mucilaginibacter sp. 21P]|nr:hypothetical protein [Mucilaginibacter sp. 21P]